MKINGEYDPKIYNPKIRQILFNAAKKLGVDNLSDDDIKRTLAECKVGKVSLE